MAASLELLSKQRAAARSWLTRTTQKVLNLLEKQDVTKEELEVALEDINSRNQKLSHIQEQIEVHLDPSELENDVEQADSYCNGAFTAISRARQRLNLIMHVPGPNTEVEDSVSSVGSGQGESPSNLPKIEMTKFDGHFADWPSFFDKFNALIGDTKLPDIAKFTYLQSLLIGDAKLAIEGLSLTADNYAIAIDILKDRFGRREKIVFGHIQNLLAIEFSSVRHGQVKQLWKVFNNLQANIRSLETLGVDGASYGLVLTPLIVSRLPADLRLMWARHSHKKEGDLTFLIDFLKGEIENRERSQSFGATTFPVSGSSHSNEHRNGNGNRRSHQRPTASALTLNTKDIICAFCSGRHTSDKCRNVYTKMNIEDVTLKIKENKLCFVCFRKGHIANRCYLSCRICKRKHNELFCKNKHPVKTNSETNPDHSETFQKTAHIDSSGSEGLPMASPTNVTFCKSKSSRHTVLQTLKIQIKGFPVTVLFDSGSDRSFITSKTVAKIKPTFHGREDFYVSSFQSEKPSDKVHRNVYALKIDLENGNEEKLLLTEVKVICPAMYKPAIPDNLLTYFQNCEFSPDIQDTNEINIDILIGQDYYWKLLMTDYCIPSPNGLVAQKTVFGQWVLSGIYSDQKDHSQNSFRQFLCLTDIPQSEFRKLWDLEYLECKHEDHVSKDRSRVMEEFSKQIKYQDGRYEVALPWKDSNKADLQLNETEARRRLVKLERKLTGDPNLKEGYNEVIRKMEVEGIIEEVGEEKHDELKPVFYLPHRPVVKNSSLTTKIRPVFDASAPGPNAISLNDCMETGPNLLPILSDILIRFRKHKIAVSADIEKAFLQVGVRPEDRDVHRFFWQVENKVRTMRFTRVPFGNKASPFLLNATIRHHLSHYPSCRVVSELAENMYCDDWLSGGDSEEEVLDLMSEASKIMSEAGMKLCKWSSNGHKVAESIQRHFLDKTVEVDTVKVLGIRWIPKEDILTFDGISISSDIVVTKRFILSCIARTFDPLGLISPFIITTKMLFQEAWKLGLGWDEQVPIEMEKQFISWVEDISKLKELSIPRCYVSLTWGEKKDVELHCFCDSSLKGYGAVVYLKILERDGSTTITLVLSKARVAPLKPVTLPRLELLGAVVGAKLLHSVKNILHLPEGVRYRCWTDSAVVLQWIRSEPTRWKMFVSNRVVQIQELTAPEYWHHCAGKENPADCLTRGLSAVDIMLKPLWFEGPPWLKFPSGEGSQTSDTEVSSINEDISESEEKSKVNVCVTRNDDALGSKRWGDFSKAVRIIAWIFRFVNNSRKRNVSKSIEISGEEIDFAYLELLKYIQRVHFADSIERLSAGNYVRRDSPLYKFNPFLDERGLMKMKTRFQFSNMSDKEKNPVILPKCHLTMLLVRREHNNLKHAGVSQMLTSLRNQFWILGLRSIAKKVKRQCVHCQRYDSMPCSQVISPLPKDRLLRADPFSIVGVDFAGPLYAVDQVGTKFYILLFTCCVVRAIHIELCENQSLTEFLMAFRRFVSRRGMPTKILSDNAKTFEAAAKQLTVLHVEESPKWIFNVPRAPWRGGVWERLIRSIKQSLKKTIGNSKLSKRELETVLFEIEACVNSRPLTKVSDDPEDDEVLSPSHFLTGRSNIHTPVKELSNALPTERSIRDAFSFAKVRLERFWEIWHKDYIRNLPLIRSNPKNTQLKIGSLVLLHEDNCPRMFWPLARIIRLLPGRDGVVRTIEVKTTRGTFIRAIQRVHSLEIEGESISKEQISETLDLNNTSEEGSIASTENQKSVDSTDPKESKEHESAQKRTSTRRRVIKPPKRLDL